MAYADLGAVLLVEGRRVETVSRRSTAAFLLSDDCSSGHGSSAISAWPCSEIGAYDAARTAFDIVAALQDELRAFAPMRCSS